MPVPLGSVVRSKAWWLLLPGVTASVSSRVAGAAAKRACLRGRSVLGPSGDFKGVACASARAWRASTSSSQVNRGNFGGAFSLVRIKWMEWR